MSSQALSTSARTGTGLLRRKSSISDLKNSTTSPPEVDAGDERLVVVDHRFVGPIEQREGKPVVRRDEHAAHRLVARLPEVDVSTQVEARRHVVEQRLREADRGFLGREIEDPVLQHRRNGGATFRPRYLLRDIVHRPLVDVEPGIGTDFETRIRALGRERNVEGGEDLIGVMHLADMQVEIGVLDQPRRPDEVGELHIEVARVEPGEEGLKRRAHQADLHLIAQHRLKRLRVALDQEYRKRAAGRTLDPVGKPRG